MVYHSTQFLMLNSMLVSNFYFEDCFWYKWSKSSLKLAEKMVFYQINVNKFHVWTIFNKVHFVEKVFAQFSRKFHEVVIFFVAEKMRSHYQGSVAEISFLSHSDPIYFSVDK